ncbi:hypothetical protein quinque_010956 [Culex quinquefasciatus]
MKTITLLLALICAALAAPGQHPESRIVGGINALPNEFPSIVSVRRVILTLTTHVCANFVIWAGSHNLNLNEDTRQVISVQRSVVHPDYLGGVNPSDIAVMRLQNPLTFTPAIQPVNLPEDNVEPRLGAATLAGWGSISGANNVSPTVLQKAVIPILDFDTCEEANGGPGASPFGPTNICTGPLTGGISACFGDGGGPLYIIENGVQTQVGISSWIWTPCGSFGRPSVYVGISHYLAWVREQLAS